jgi:NADPH:quinone reductase-like Zn-dependent oxidoreductase
MNTRYQPNCLLTWGKIYVTVGSDEKAKYLVDRYNVPRERIFDSHSTSFLGNVMKATAGRGVDVVLNSLSGELLHASWSCVAKYGKMLEIGKRDILEHGSLALDMFQFNRSYHGIDLESLLNERPQVLRK